jgi:hypothetical protein
MAGPEVKDKKKDKSEKADKADKADKDKKVKKPSEGGSSKPDKEKKHKDGSKEHKKDKEGSKKEGGSKKERPSSSSSAPATRTPPPRPPPKKLGPAATDDYLAGMDLPSTSESEDEREEREIDKGPLVVATTDREVKKLADKERLAMEKALQAKKEALREDENVFDVSFEGMGNDEVVSATDVKVGLGGHTSTQQQQLCYTAVDRQQQYQPSSSTRRISKQYKQQQQYSSSVVADATAGGAGEGPKPAVLSSSSSTAAVHGCHRVWGCMGGRRVCSIAFRATAAAAVKAGAAYTLDRAAGR